MNRDEASCHFPRIGSRAAERSRVEVMVDTRNGQTRFRAMVVDVSMTGVRLRTLNPLRQGQTFWVKLPMIEPRMIIVKWVDGFVSGCAFQEALAPYVLEHVLASAPSEPEVPSPSFAADIGGSICAHCLMNLSAREQLLVTIDRRTRPI